MAISLVPLLAGLVASLIPSATLADASDRLDLLPLPTEYTVGDTVVCLHPNFGVKFDSHAPDDLVAAADHMVERIQKSKHRYLSPSYGAEFFVKGGCETFIESLVISVRDKGSIFKEAVKPVDGRTEREAYELKVPVEGGARASAPTALGGFRALTTFENLWFKADLTRGGSGLRGSVHQTALTAHPRAKATYAPFAPYDIKDQPTFPWRAVLLDTSRHYFVMDSIQKMLDTMASVKLNVFHWHITDSDSWPLELEGFPQLAEKGAYGDRTYNEVDVRHIIQYAGERGIDVVMEIDTPGHTAVIGEVYPDLIACRNHRPWTGWANQPPAGQLRFADEQVVNLTSSIFNAAASLTASAYFGSGGDELNLRCMREDGPTQDLLKEKGWSLEDALREYTRRTHATLLEKGRTPVVWQEMVLEHGDLNLDPRTVVDIWQSSQDVRAVLDKGYRIVHAASDYFYLDCGQGGWITTNGGSNSWCDPFKDWIKMYSFDPFANVAPEQRNLVLGGQASLWAEQTDDTNLETVMWPRAAAVAELWWTGAGKGSYPRSAINALPRMHDIRYRLVERGVRAVPLQPEWCALRPGACVLGA